MLNKIAFVFILLLASDTSCILAQSRIDYFQQNVTYDIDAQLNANQLNATAEITYTNNSKNTLDTLYFHLWMNALSNKNTPFSKQLLNTNQREFYFFRSDELGGYQNIEVSINQEPIELKFQSNSNEIAYIVLPNLLPPKGRIRLHFKYKIKIPKLITRMGINDEVTQLVHWYPRLAVYDDKGWHTFPYLAWGEYYGEYSDFKINLTHNDSCMIVAPFIKSQENGITKIASKKVIDCPIIIYPKKQDVTSNSGLKNGIMYKTHYVNDSSIWSKAIPIAKEVIDFYIAEIGPFPYNEIVIVQGPSNLSSAMEYPGLIIINEYSNERALEYYIAHEIAHQYFYGALGFNERQEPFMDEGLATFYEDKYTHHKYKTHYYNEKAPSFLKIEPEPLLFLNAFKHQCNRHQNQALTTPIDELTPINYALNSYPRAASLFKLMEDYLGKETFRKSLRAYYLDRMNSHVNKSDFISALENSTRQSFEWVNYIIDQKEVNFSIKEFKGQYKITSNKESQWPIPLLIKMNQTIIDTIVILSGGVGTYTPKTQDLKNIIIDPNLLYTETNRKDNRLKVDLDVSFVPFVGQDKSRTTEIYILPLINFNTSDGIMPSFALYNSSFPSKTLKWLINPSYSIKNKEFNGEGWVKYDHFISKNLKSYFQPALSFKKYSFEKNSKFGYNLNYSKIGGRLSYISNNHSKVLSNLSLSYDNIKEERPVFTSSELDSFKYIRFNTFRLDYKLDINKSPTSTKITTSLSYLPKYESGKGTGTFARLDLCLSKRYYYQDKKSLDIRLWTGYFIYNNKRNALSYNNQLVRGSTSLIYNESNDYAYDHNFIDRNNGSINQSSSELGGGFKTVFNNRNLGQTNDLAFSINLKCDLPIKSSKYLPISAFFDFGGYSVPIDQKSTINYLYSGGLSLTYFKGALQIHLPIVNSEEINRIYTEEGTFFRRVSFTLDLLKINPWTKFDHLDFLF